MINTYNMISPTLLLPLLNAKIDVERKEGRRRSINSSNNKLKATGVFWRKFH